MPKTLLLRTCPIDMVSRNGFTWPESGPVECSDWSPVKKCGNGLHGLLPGQNDPGVFHTEGRWLIVEVASDEIVDLGGKSKFGGGVVVHCGDRASASAYMADHGSADGLYMRLASGGHRSTLTGGDGSTLTGGYRSTLTGGHRSTLTGGDGSTLTGGHRSTLTGGDGSTLTGRSESTLGGWE